MCMRAYFPEAPKLGFRPNSCPLRCILTKTACSWGLEKTLTINCDAEQQLNSAGCRSMHSPYAAAPGQYQQHQQFTADFFYTCVHGLKLILLL